MFVSAPAPAPMSIPAALSFKTSVTDASLSVASNPNWASKENFPLWYGATSLVTLPSLSGRRSEASVARFFEALTTCSGVIPHFVYSQSGFFVYSQAPFAALEQIRNASSNIDLKSAFSSEGAQQESASTIPRSFIFMWPSSRNERLGKNSSPDHRQTQPPCKEQ